MSCVIVTSCFTVVCNALDIHPCGKLGSSHIWAADERHFLETDCVLRRSNAIWSQRGQISNSNIPDVFTQTVLGSAVNRTNLNIDLFSHIFSFPDK